MMGCLSSNDAIPTELGVGEEEPALPGALSQFMRLQVLLI